MSDTRAAKAAPRLFLVELSAFLAIFWADWAGHIPIPMTPLLFLAAWMFMLLRGVTWKSVGYRIPRHALLIATIGLGAGAAMFLLEFFVVQEALQRWTGEYPDLHQFDDVVGNIPLLMVYLTLNFLLAALCEELVWRGYALPRVASLFGDSWASWLTALLIVNLGFGLAHLSQGLPGIIENTWAGILLGVLYLVTGRNLIAPIIAHFTSNTIDLTVMYLGLYPGVGN